MDGRFLAVDHHIADPSTLDLSESKANSSNLWTAAGIRRLKHGRFSAIARLECKVARL